jgi:hypothetical protein
VAKVTAGLALLARPAATAREQAHERGEPEPPAPPSALGRDRVREVEEIRLIAQQVAHLAIE